MELIDEAKCIAAHVCAFFVGCGGAVDAVDGDGAFCGFVEEACDV